MHPGDFVGNGRAAGVAPKAGWLKPWQPWAAAPVSALSATTASAGNKAVDAVCNAAFCYFIDSCWRTYILGKTVI
jgi:hypothetical protein